MQRDLHTAKKLFFNSEFILHTAFLNRVKTAKKFIFTKVIICVQIAMLGFFLFLCTKLPFSPTLINQIFFSNHTRLSETRDVVQLRRDLSHGHTLR